MTRHAMIDVETLNVGTRAPIFEIGLSIFDATSFEEQVQCFIELDVLDVMLQTGFCPNQDTLNWWRQQEYKPTKAKNLRVTLSDGLKEVTALLIEYPIEKVWANSPSFDLVLMEAHYDALGMSAPWSYKQELDFRTIRWLAQQRGWEQPEKRPDHNALNDARLQTQLLSEMLTHV